MTHKCQSKDCCQKIPEKPNCAHCFKDGLSGPGEYFVVVFYTGKAFWLCEEHHQKGQEKLKK